MLSTVTIRAARLTDLYEIWRVHSTAIHTTCRGHYDHRVLRAWTERLTPEGYRDVLARATMVVAKESDGVVGFGQLDPSTGEVQAVYVAPEAQGRGIGAALLGHLEHAATLEGRTQLTPEGHPERRPVLCRVRMARGRDRRPQNHRRDLPGLCRDAQGPRLRARRGLNSSNSIPVS